MIGSGDYVGLMPRPLALHPAAAPFLAMPPLREGALELSIGAITRTDTALKPAMRHFIAHLQRAAHQISRQQV